MRASEFINEGAYASGKIRKRMQYPTKGLHKFRDPNGYDRTYEMNRIGMALACTDGTNVPEVDPESWSGRYNTAHPYTEVEHDMLKKAYQVMGSSYEDINKGDMASDELDQTHTKSPVAKRPKDFRGKKKK